LLDVYGKLKEEFKSQKKKHLKDVATWGKKIFASERAE
jgi:hypothetical protein